MSARVKRATAAQDAVDCNDGWIVVEVLKKRPYFDVDGKRKGWIRRTIVGRANKDLPHQPEAASERSQSNEVIKPERDQTD
jgi:hypothetical protein